jgi:small subunit ribosomal protein S13
MMQEKKNAAMPKDSKEMKEKRENQRKDEKKVEVKKAQVAREIVRVAGIDLNGNLKVNMAFNTIKGIGYRTAEVLANQFFEKSKLPRNVLLGNIPAENDEILSEIISKIKLPNWMTNRQKDLYTGDDLHLTSSDLIFSVREDKQRLSRIKARRGMRLQAGLRVRGQRTKSNFRRKMGVVGVVKKSSQPGKAAPKAPAPAPKAKPAGKK